MIRLEMKNYSTMSTGTLQKYKYFLLDKCEYLTGEEILPPNGRQVIEQAKLTYFLLENALEKQTGKQVCDYELKQVEGIFPKTLLTDLIENKVKELIKLQSINLD